jgi:hypothetical protein
MPLPPSIRVLAPSLSLDHNSKTATLSLDDFTRLIAFALESVIVDEDWYIARYSDVREEVQASGSKSYAIGHYRAHGFLEGRLPHDPRVDEEWYRKSYPDIDEAIRLGKETDAKSHFIDHGYQEGRKARPDTAPTVGAPSVLANNRTSRLGARVPTSRAAVPM